MSTPGRERAAKSPPALEEDCNSHAGMGAVWPGDCTRRLLETAAVVVVVPKIKMSNAATVNGEPLGCILKSPR